MAISTKEPQTIKDLNERTDLHLVTDYDEVKHLLILLGIRGVNPEQTGLFVKELNGDIVECFAFEGSIPYLGSLIIRLHP